jgi:CheY-like chemotaxis protein
MDERPLDILVVEDNPDHAELIKRGMAELRVLNTLHHVADGEAALDYLYRRGAFAAPASSPVPHVILLDLRLPKVDGMEVLRTIKADPGLRAIPVIVLTTSQAEGDMARAYESHVNSYLVKPLNFETFVRLMGDMGFYWLGWNREPPRRQPGGENG